jgi:hypothetical protein
MEPHSSYMFYVQPESVTEGVHDAEASSADEESKEQAVYWKNLVEGDGTATREAPNLVSFLMAKQKREIATEQFSMALDECMSGMAGSVEETLQDSVVPYHEEKRVRMESLHEDIVATMKENHKKRTSMRERLETANVAWTKAYGRLMAEVLGKEPAEVNKILPVIATRITSNYLGLDFDLKVCFLRCSF